MDVDAQDVIEKLANQIKEMVKLLAIKDCQIEILQKEVAKISVREC